MSFKGVYIFPISDKGRKGLSCYACGDRFKETNYPFPLEYEYFTERGLKRGIDFQVVIVRRKKK